MRPPLPLLLLALLLVPVGPAASPEPMVVWGRAVANGQPLPEGAILAAYVGEAGPFGAAPVGADGGFSLSIPPDDPGTPALEGPVPGDRLAFRALGGVAEAPPIAYAPGGHERADLAFRLADAAVVSVDAPEAREGREAFVRAVVENRGEARAEGLRVLLREQGEVVDLRPVADLSPGGQRTVLLRVPTARVGNVSLLVAVEGVGGDLHASDSTVALVVRVEADLGPEVVLSHEPLRPVAGERVRLVASASDPDGVASVRFFWDAGAGIRSQEVDQAPFHLDLDALPPGTRVEYSALAADRGPLRRTTVTPMEAFEVDAPASAEPTPLPPSVASTPARHALVPGPAPPILVAAALLAGLARRVPPAPAKAP